MLFLRGDLDLNETKLTNDLGEEVHPALIHEDSGLQTGFIGPCGLDGSFTVLFDRSLEGPLNLTCGANREGFHYTCLLYTSNFV